MISTVCDIFCREASLFGLGSILVAFVGIVACNNMPSLRGVVESDLDKCARVSYG